MFGVIGLALHSGLKLKPARRLASSAVRRGACAGGARPRRVPCPVRASSTGEATCFPSHLSVSDYTDLRRGRAAAACALPRARIQHGCQWPGCAEQLGSGLESLPTLQALSGRSPSGPAGGASGAGWEDSEELPDRAAGVRLPRAGPGRSESLFRTDIHVCVPSSSATGTKGFCVSVRSD